MKGIGSQGKINHPFFFPNKIDQPLIQFFEVACAEVVNFAYKYQVNSKPSGDIPLTTVTDY